MSQGFKFSNCQHQLKTFIDPENHQVCKKLLSVSLKILAQSYSCAYTVSARTPSMSPVPWPVALTFPSYANNRSLGLLQIEETLDEHKSSPGRKRYFNIVLIFFLILNFITTRQRNKDLKELKKKIKKEASNLFPKILFRFSLKCHTTPCLFTHRLPTSPLLALN